MKNGNQWAALFGFLGCLALIAIASQGNDHTTCTNEWGTFVQKQVVDNKKIKDAQLHQLHTDKKLYNPNN
jgi:hypothetical protein